jgi:hypothetical protein
MLYHPFLHLYPFLCMCEQCRSRSAGTFMLSDQDLHCSLFCSSWKLENMINCHMTSNQISLKCRSQSLPKHSVIYRITFLNPFLHNIYAFYVYATSVDPDQLAHLCHLICICTGRILVRYSLMNKIVNSLDGTDVPADLDLNCSP